mmetsp:Transcript_71218/g.170556  ORF Transcript_71218/g.170556 Transcript_71218/m.170556 type:complete len:289 (+) Transcript_71218:196-1062(+)
MVLWGQAQSSSEEAKLSLVGSPAFFDDSELLCFQELSNLFTCAFELDGLALPRSLLYLGNKGPIATGCDSSYATSTSTSCSASDPVQIIGDVQGKIIHHDVVNVTEVNPTAGKICAHHDVSARAVEVRPHLLPFLRSRSPMQGHSIQPTLNHRFVQDLAATDTVGEDERLATRSLSLRQDFPEHGLPTLSFCGHKHLFHLRRRHVSINRRNGHDSHITEVLRNECRHSPSPGSAHNDNLWTRWAILLKSYQYFLDVLLVESVHEGVGFVDHNVPDLVQVHVTLRQMQD